jgi:hypothetical protein
MSTDGDVVAAAADPEKIREKSGDDVIMADGS